MTHLPSSQQQCAYPFSTLERTDPSLDILFESLLKDSQWAIYSQTREQVNWNCCLFGSKCEGFSQICQEIQQLYGDFWENNSPNWINIAHNPHLSVKIRHKLTKSHLFSLLRIPLWDQSNTQAILYISQPDKTDQWQQKDIIALQALGQQALFKLQQQQIKTEIDRPNNLIQTIYHYFNQSDHHHLSWELILADIGRYFGVEQVVLLRFLSTQTIVEHEWRSHEEIPLWTTPIPIESSCDLRSYEYHTYTQCLDTHHPQKSNIALHLALKAREHCFGRLILQTFHSERRFSQDEIRFLELIGDIIAFWGIHQQFSQKLSEIDEKNQTKAQFLSYMTHELRTPMAGILGFAKMLNKELYGELNEKQKEYVKGIVSSGEHLMSLIDDFLDFSKLEAQKEELMFEPMVVEELCQSVFVIVQPKAMEQGLDLILTLAPDVDICTGDQRKLKQILLNLLSNAIKFTEKGSVTLKVTRETHLLAFSVIDTGIGIKPEDQPKLFEPFEQIKTRLSQKQKGTGLGLAISRQLALLHGGDLTFTSQDGKGSCFTLSIPIMPLARDA